MSPKTLQLRLSMRCHSCSQYEVRAREGTVKAKILRLCVLALIIWKQWNVSDHSKTREDAYLPLCTMIAFDLQQLSMGFGFGFDDVFESRCVVNMSAATRVAHSG